ncbi:unnamed protein product [Pylaiella littoralis]
MLKKKIIKYNIFGNVLSDGSFHFCLLTNSYLKESLNYKSVDILNHPVWTGKRQKEQSEISLFIGRLTSK